MCPVCSSRLEFLALVSCCRIRDRDTLLECSEPDDDAIGHHPEFGSLNLA